MSLKVITLAIFELQISLSQSLKEDSYVLEMSFYVWAMYEYIIQISKGKM